MILRGKLVFLLLTSFLCKNSYAQEATKISDHYIQCLNVYRSYLLFSQSVDLKELDQFYRKWRTVGGSNRARNNITLNLIIEIGTYQHSLKKIKKRAKKLGHYPNHVIKKIKNKDIDLVTDNLAILELLNDGMLERAFPFRVDTQSLFLWELQHYEIRDGMRIGEIAAGTGTFSLGLALCYSNLTLYINELSPSFVYRIQERLDSCAILLSDDVQVIQGKKQSTQLEGQQLDKIIMRKSLHHFKQPIAMLKSIHSSLKPGGELFIMEPVTDFDPDKKSCPKITNKKTIIEQAEANGFRLSKDTRRKRMALLKFVKS